jgi:hypothetical protein
MSETQLENIVEVAILLRFIRLYSGSENRRTIV